jgi:CRISPR-associated protein Csm3
MSLKLVEHVTIQKKLTLKTGMRIGGTKNDIEIGGLDNPIIRDPLSKFPYIPGSSLKGKMRSLLEWKEGKIGTKGEPHGCNDINCLICKVFGPHMTSGSQHGPTRILVRDAMLNTESEKELEEKLADSLYAEIKQEVIIDRNTGKAAVAGPRPMERVPAGAVFDLYITLRIFEGDKKQDMVAFIEKGLKLLTDDAFGGSGSRGYGWVEIK